jgi:beta-N-acetylhexosaminidase
MPARSLVIGLVFVLSACSSQTDVTVAPPTPSPTAMPTMTDSATPSPAATPDPVEQALSAMTPEERIGQLLMPYAYGASADDVTPAQAAANRQIYGVETPAELVATYHLGGVIFLPRNTLHPTLDRLATENTTDPASVPALANGLQAAALGDSGVPLLIATDQEEGLVTRIGAPLAEFPGSMPLGATGDANLARNVAAATGRELAAVGVNLDLAPDADVNVEPANPVIGLRSFGDDPSLVSRLVAAQVAGYQDDAGIGAAAKHFPGHGDTKVDSHVGLPVIRHDQATWERVDLPPFTSAIEAGADVVMAGHLLVPALDADEPATLSSKILTALLREQLGFDGVIMTDSLWMAGIRSRVQTDAEAALRAFQAGADILLMPPDLGGTVARFEAALDSGEISRERLDASVRRVLQLKQRLGLLAPTWKPTAAAPAAADLTNDRALADEAAQAAVTLLAWCGSYFPGDGGRTVVIGLAGPGRDLADALPSAVAVPIDFNPTAGQRGAALHAARSASAVVYLSYDANASSAQRQLLSSLVALPAPVIAVSIDLTYDLSVTANAAAQLATYGAGTTSMRGLAAALAANRFMGRLPVAVPAAAGGIAFSRGAGLSACPAD